MKKGCTDRHIIIACSYALVLTDFEKHYDFRRNTKKRVLSEKCQVQFTDSKEGNQFIVRVSRPLTANQAASNENEAVSKEEIAASKDNEAKNKQIEAVSKEEELLIFCSTPKSLTEICEFLGLKDKYKAKKKFINPILNKKIGMTEPDSPNSPTQKYVTIKS